MGGGTETETDNGENNEVTNIYITHELYITTKYGFYNQLL